MKSKLKYLISLLLFSLVSCSGGNKGYVGRYYFLMGKVRGDHFSMELNLTDENIAKPVEPAIKITNPTQNIKLGTSYQLTWSTVCPEGKESEYKVEFEIDDSTIATVSETGLIETKAVGKTRVYATYGYDIDLFTFTVSEEDTTVATTLDEETNVTMLKKFTFSIQSTMNSSEEGNVLTNLLSEGFTMSGGYTVNEDEKSPDKGKISLDVFTYSEVGKPEIILPANLLDGLISLFYTGNSIKITLPVSLNDALKDIIAWWEKEQRDPTTKHVTLELMKD